MGHHDSTFREPQGHGASGSPKVYPELSPQERSPGSRTNSRPSLATGRDAGRAHPPVGTWTTWQGGPWCWLLPALRSCLPHAAARLPAQLFTGHLARRQGGRDVKTLTLAPLRPQGEMQASQPGHDPLRDKDTPVWGRAPTKHANPGGASRMSSATVPHLRALSTVTF